MKHNRLTNTILGLTALTAGFLATSCGGSKEFTSYHNNIPQATVENFSPEIYTFNTLVDLVKENADSTVNGVAYKTVSIDLNGTSYVDAEEQKNSIDFLLRYKGNGLEFVKKSIKGNDEFEFYRINLAGKEGKQELEAQSAHGTVSGENLESNLYNSFAELDGNVQDYEPQKVFYMLYMFKEQLEGQSIFNDGYKEGQLALPVKSSYEEPVTTPATNTNNAGTNSGRNTSGRQGF